jgi:hypothetical protein
MCVSTPIFDNISLHPVKVILRKNGLLLNTKKLWLLDYQYSFWTEFAANTTMSKATCKISNTG